MGYRWVGGWVMGPLTSVTGGRVNWVVGPLTSDTRGRVNECHVLIF